MARLLVRCLGLLLMVIGHGVAMAAPPTTAPRVVASIPPLHSLVAAVTNSITEPHLLLRAGASPHTYTLRPSDARLLHGAALIFLIDLELETFLRKPLAALGADTRVVTLSTAPNLLRLGNRPRGMAAAHDHRAAGHAHHADFDPHIWLDPENARAMVRAIVAALVETDPDNVVAYRANAERLERRLDVLDRDLRERLTPLQEIPYAVFHDAYRYLERRYDLNSVVAVTLDPERRPGARRLREIRRRLADAGVQCLFTEPQFPPAIAETVIEGSDARRGVLDPLGADLPPGSDLYFTLMRGLAGSLGSCLSDN